MRLTRIKQFTAAFGALLLIYGCAPAADDDVTPTIGGDATIPAGGAGVGTAVVEQVDVSDLIAQAGSRVYFGFDRHDLDADARAILVAQADVLKANGMSTITVQGHCDDRGTRDYNLALGERRANAVKNYLVALGVAAGRIDVISYGFERPAVVGSNEAAWAQNRRGVTVIN